MSVTENLTIEQGSSRSGFGPVNDVLFSLRIVVAALANVPPRGYFAARRNARAAFAQRPDLIVFTEAWWPWTYRGILSAAPDRYRFVRVRKPGGGRRGSVVIAYDSHVYEELHSGIVILHGSSRWWDTREMPWLVLRHRKTSRIIRFGGLHLSPKGTSHGTAAVEESRTDHVEADHVLVGYTASSERLTFYAGDTNETGIVLPEDIDGRDVDQVSAPGDPIIKVIRVQGENAVAREVEHRTFQMSKSDHLGLTVDYEVRAA